MEANNNRYKSKDNDVDSEEYLFDPALLKNIKWSDRKSLFDPDISPWAPGENLIVRPLSINDYHRGFLQLLGQLTDVGSVTEQQFRDQFRAMKNTPLTYYILVVEDIVENRIAASTTLLIERKFIHSAGQRARIEDVVVNSKYRKQQLGKLVVEALTLLSRELGCYKISLECKDHLIPFYESFGYIKDPGNNFMVQRFS